MHDEIVKALEVLNNGGVILYPTDTVWGLGCDATNKEAIEKIFKLKERYESKSLIVLVDNDGRMERHFKEVPEVAWQLIDASEKPVTVILPNPIGIAPNAIAEDNTLGIRIANDEFCQKLIQRFKRPIISTSANISGQPTPSNFNEISKEVLERVDYVVNLRRDEQQQSKPSSIIKLGVNGEIEIIRK